MDKCLIGIKLSRQGVFGQLASYRCWIALTRPFMLLPMFQFVAAL
jgi:hypothetical protein